MQAISVCKSLLTIRQTELLGSGPGTAATMQTLHADVAPVSA